METSILKSTKKVLGISTDPDDTSFDHDVLTYINSTFSILTQMGVGPPTFQIEDGTSEWGAFIPDDDIMRNFAKTYMGLKVGMMFDPPSTSYLLVAAEKKILELEWRMNTYREGLIAAAAEAAAEEA